MEERLLQDIIDRLESTNSINDAYWGLFEYDGAGINIEANRQGLELFAARLLRASKNARQIVSGKGKNTILLDHQEEWIDGELVIRGIKPILKNRDQIFREFPQRNWKDKIFEFGCLMGIILFIIFFVIGVASSIQWVF